MFSTLEVYFTQSRATTYEPRRAQFDKNLIFFFQVLRGEHDKVTTIWPINVRKILGENVLVNSLGNIHRHKRKITCKAFTRASLETYLPLMQKHARRHVSIVVSLQCRSGRKYVACLIERCSRFDLRLILIQLRHRLILRSSGLFCDVVG